MIKMPQWLKKYFKNIFSSKLNRKGYFEIYINNKYVETVNNLITNNGLDEMIEILQGTVPDCQIKYLAFGDDNTPTTGLETVLGNELHRIALEAQDKLGTGRLQSQFTLKNTELASTTIEEFGVFGGSGATSTANTGLLIARALWHKEKSSDEEINIRRIDEIIRS